MGAILPRIACSLGLCPDVCFRTDGTRDAQYRLQTAVDVGLGGGPGGDADPHGVASLPDGSPAPAGAVFLYAADDALSDFRRTERDENLVQNHLVKNFELH